MPKKNSVYTRNKDFVDALRQQGKSWQEVASALAEVGIKCTRAGLHSAYQTWLRHEASKNEEKTEETDSKPLEPLLMRAKDEAEAARVAGNLEISDADQLRQWARNLDYYSPTLAHKFLDSCKGKALQGCLSEFEKHLEIVKEVIKRTNWRT
jgi:hypothetical protein